ncbi:hypothetical protein B0H14DRAFT_3452381 [Mycena olivaceomarginata]|nr:hypothetical protein B0H14DRAFT_3452381 [Mycena olivaceomarginata]
MKLLSFSPSTVSHRRRRCPPRAPLYTSPAPPPLLAQNLSHAELVTPSNLPTQTKAVQKELCEYKAILFLIAPWILPPVNAPAAQPLFGQELSPNQMAPKPISTSASSFTAADRAATERAAASSERANRLARRATSTPAAERPATTTTATTAPRAAVPEVPTTAMSGPATLPLHRPRPLPPPLPPAIVIPTADTTMTTPPWPSFPPQTPPRPSSPPWSPPSYAAVTAAPGPAGPMDVDTAASNSDAAATPPVRDPFPPLPSPGANVQSPAARRKDNKGKGKDKASPRAPTPDVEEIEDPDLGGFFSDDGETASRLGKGEGDVTRSATYTRGIDLAHHALILARRRRRRHGQLHTSPKRQRSNTAGESIPSPRVPRSPGPDTARGEHGRIHNPTAVRPINPFSPPPIERRFPTADGLPPRGTYTAAPANGWRSLYGFEADAFLAFVMGVGNGDRTQTAGRIATAIAGYINVDPASVLVGAPGLGTGAGPDARAWLIGGLPENLAQVVLESRCLCSTAITLFFLQYTPLITGFLGTIGGLIIPNTRQGRATAMGIIEDAISNDSAITRFVRDHRDSFPSHLDADQALDIFLTSIGVDAIELPPPQQRRIVHRLEQWNQLRRLFALLVIDTTYYGEGRIHPPMSCNLCPSTDHPGPLCPFPHVDGWLGATSANIGELLDISRTARARALGPSNNAGGNRGRGGSRGGRGKSGRGNARGGRGRGN